MYDQTGMNLSSFMNEILTHKLENISVLSVAVNNDSIKIFQAIKLTSVMYVKYLAEYISYKSRNSIIITE
jgi:hypothetical protein